MRALSVESCISREEKSLITTIKKTHAGLLNSKKISPTHQKKWMNW